MIDTHAHLVSEDFDADQADAVARACDAGVVKIVNVGSDLKSSRLATQQAEQWDGVYASVGLHPHEAEKWNEDTGKELLSMASHPKVVAVGETGLDFHYEFSSHSAQEQAFRSSIDIALRADLPLIIHNREADAATLAVLTEMKSSNLRGVVHCFTSDTEFALRCVELGFYIGFTGIITFRKADRLREVVKAVPHDRILIETDCPYLAPQGFRGKRNEPAFVVAVAEKLAEILGKDLAEIEESTTKNAERLFARLQ